MIGATSYPTKDEAKAARKVAVEAGQCIKKDKSVDQRSTQRSVVGARFGGEDKSLIINS